MPITPLPPAPSRQSPADFSARMDNFLAALVIFQQELDAVAAGESAAALAVNLASTASGMGAELSGYKAPGSGSVARTTGDKLAEVISARDKGADPTGVANSTAAIAAALASTSGDVVLGPGTFTVAGLAAVAGKRLIGQGSDRTTLRIAPGSTLDIITGSAIAGFELAGVTLDYTGGGSGSGRGAYFSGVTNLRLHDVKTRATKGHGIWLLNCPGYRYSGIAVDAAGDWAMLIDGASTVDGLGSDLKITNCLDRGLMMRGVTRCQHYGVTANNNRATAAWILDCLHSQIVGVTDYMDLVGDTAVIEGASVGCTITHVIAKTCGGHGASISASATAAPIDCHISHVYSDGQGESIAVITDQGTGFRPTNCTISAVKGKNCGRVTPAEGFGISNAIGCTITGNITDTVGTMTYAVREGGAAPSNNRFGISGWVAGSAGYFQISSSTSGIDFQLLERGVTRVGDADLSWAPGADRRLVLYDQAPLTAARTVTLGASWAGDQVRVTRIAAGAGSLAVKQGAATLKTLSSSAQWADFYFDGANWNLISSGTV